MGFIETAKEYLASFAYWQQAAFLIGGMILAYILQAVGKILRTRRLALKGKRRNLVVIESRNHRKRKKEDMNTLYFEYIKNAQYSADELEPAKDKKSGINLIK